MFLNSPNSLAISAWLIVFLMLLQFWNFWPIWPLCCYLFHGGLLQLLVRDAFCMYWTQGSGGSLKNLKSICQNQKLLNLQCSWIHLIPWLFLPDWLYFYCCFSYETFDPFDHYAAFCLTEVSFSEPQPRVVGMDSPSPWADTMLAYMSLDTGECLTATR